MSNPQSYYLQRNGTEEGPLTIAQVNRMKQRREIAADTPCRTAQEIAFHRLDEVLPHLKDQQAVNPEKIAKLKQDIATHEIASLTKMAFGSAALFWAPLGIGVITASTAIGCGGVLLFKHRKPIGLVAMFLGASGLCMRFYRVFSR
ncbi:MAG: hypothetical protein RL088_1120 [Verrucomicrobiota bacterium]